MYLTFSNLIEVYEKKFIKIIYLNLHFFTKIQE